jgi:hypothetical protein
LEHVVHDPGARWRRQAPADGAAVARLAAELPTLPADYLAFLRLSNGGEGDLGVEPGWFQLWRAEDVSARNFEYAVPEFLPGYVGFGSSGGGELLAFGPGGRGVYAVPFVPMDPAEAQPVASDFTQLARAFGRVALNGQGHR